LAFKRCLNEYYIVMENIVINVNKVCYVIQT